MEKRLTYYDMAENDYEFLKEDYENGRVGNIICYSAQNICERYLKHIIDVYCTQEDTTTALRTHNIRVLRSFIQTRFADFKCDWNKVLLVNGYYYDARYPGEDALIATREDVDICWQAVEETRNAVKTYLVGHPFQQSVVNDEIMQILKKF